MSSHRDLEGDGFWLIGRVALEGDGFWLMGRVALEGVLVCAVDLVQRQMREQGEARV